MAATVVFIWSNSLESVAVSSEKSSRWLQALTFILEPVLGEGNVTDHLIRKIAHFVEFALLGIWLALFIVVRNRVSLQAVANCLFFGLSVAIIDEALQLLSDRGSQVLDVLLDFAGVTSGVLFVVSLWWLIARGKKSSSS